MEIALILVFFFTVGSRQKKNNGIPLKWNTITPSHHSKVSSTQNEGVPFFYCLDHEV